MTTGGGEVVKMLNDPAIHGERITVSDNAKFILSSSDKPLIVSDRHCSACGRLAVLETNPQVIHPVNANAKEHKPAALKNPLKFNFMINPLNE